MSSLDSVAPPNLSSSSRQGKPVIAYLKPSDYCNVGCDHCYLPLAIRADKTRMTFEVLDRAIETIRDMVRGQRAPGAMVIWHGGEPLALPEDYFWKACERVREQMPDAIQSIQTSLVPYRKSWAPLIRTFMDSHIGTSIDFSQRKIRDSVERYHDLWLDKVALARGEGFSITPGVVPSRGELGRGTEIVEWMLDHQFLEWNIDRYNSFGGEDKMRPLNVEHSVFLTEVFDAVMALARNKTFMKVNTVQAALSGIILNVPGDRWGGSCSRDFIVVNPDGSTSACPDKISFEDFGNITGGYEAFSKSEARKAWIRLHMTGHGNEHCTSCQFRSFCRSGCPLTPNAPASEGECSGYHRHLTHVSKFARENPEVALGYLRETAR